MRLGIFAKTFARPSLAQTLDAVVAHDLFAIQLNLQSAGIEPMPAAVSSALIDEIRHETESRGIAISSLSGTFNMIHADSTVVATGLSRLDVLASSARGMGVDLITLCTGSRNRENMWHRDPDNDTDAAWTDLLSAMDAALEIADRHDVRLGVEPEPGNVINSAEKCRRLLDHFNSARLGVVFDPANLASTNLSREPSDLLNDAFDLLGDEIVMGHGKDCGPRGEIVPAGKGIVPWKLVLDRFEHLSNASDVPMIIHGVDEADVSEVVTYLRRQSGAAE
jgi:sugar phosphate isomerase/epimerase